MGSLSLLQGIFLTQELNWGLLHCRRVLYQLSYQGSPCLSLYFHRQQRLVHLWKLLPGNWEKRNRKGGPWYVVASAVSARLHLTGTLRNHEERTPWGRRRECFSTGVHAPGGKSCYPWITLELTLLYFRVCTFVLMISMATSESPRAANRRHNGGWADVFSGDLSIQLVASEAAGVSNGLRRGEWDWSYIWHNA